VKWGGSSNTKFATIKGFHTFEDFKLWSEYIMTSSIGNFQDFMSRSAHRLMIFIFKYLVTADSS